MSARIVNDTICAIATPIGTGGIGIVRVSGPRVRQIAESVLGRCPSPRKASHCAFVDAAGITIDTGIALYFQKPNSFTGEDVLELQGHGGMVVQEMLCERIQESGARLARPGEFTERAYLNDRMDLAQAEAVADLINASSVQAARASARSLSGEFSREVMAIDKSVLDLRVYVEGAIDFAEEEIDFLADESIVQRASAIEQRLEILLRKTELGVAIQKGLHVAIAGAPNVGKSSLLNALLNADRAIVSEIAGTTRDTLDATIQLHGVPVHLVDTAGIHESSDGIEGQGIARAKQAMENADLVLWVVDDQNVGQDWVPDCNHLVVRNKCDLTEQSPGNVNGDTVRVSALKSWGLDVLRERVHSEAGFQMSDSAYAGRPRHLAALNNAQSSLRTALVRLEEKAGEVAAEELRSAHRFLGEVIGETSTDDLLGEIFSRFCIGK